jgi:hypothetical protein
MKKNFYRLAIVLLGVAALASCEKKEQEINLEENDAQKVTVTFGLSDETKATFDEAGIKWAAGDVIRFTDQGLGNVKDVTLTSSDISSDGYSATITESFYLLNKAVFRHNWSPRNAAEWDYGYMGNYAEGCSFTEWNKLVVAQSAAGQINKNFVLLHSGLNALTFDPGTTSFSVKMEILGTILRVLPYTETYNDEVVKKVTLSSTDRLGGVVGVTYADGTYRDHKDIGWGPDTFKDYVVNLTTAFSLTGVTSREASKAIYFALPATNSGHDISGYTFTVETDKAVYTFDGSAKTLALSHNKVRNFYLKLENATSRVSNDEKYGVYWFDGNIGNRDIDADETTIADCGYWVAYTMDSELGSSAVVAREPNAAPQFFENLTITVIDNATSTTADWLTYGYTNSSSSHMTLHASANTSSSSRSATVTISYPATVPHYSLREGTTPKTLTITQSGAYTLVPTLSNLSSDTMDKDGGSVTATISLNLNGNTATDAEFNQYIDKVTFDASNCSVSRSGNVLTITAGANPYTTTRTLTVTATANGGNSVLNITQEAATSAKVYSFTYSLDAAWSVSSCKPRELGYDKTAKSDMTGHWVILLTNLAESGNAYTAGAAFPSTDVEPLVKAVLGMTDAEYTAASEWLELGIQVEGAQWIIVIKGMTENTTGAQRGIQGSFKKDDGTDWDSNGTYHIFQNP